MASARYDHVWELMRRNDYRLTGDVSEEYKCIICHNIFINACSAPCGCRFCMDCIHNYLNQCADQHCPGDTENCKDDTISFVRDIQIDHAINTRIAKIVVECPSDGCDFQGELRRMANHLQACKSRKTQCPFVAVGCAGTSLATEKVDEHLAEGEASHRKLLVDCVASLRSDMVSIRLEMEKLRRDADMKQVAIFNLETDKLRSNGQIVALEQLLKDAIESKQTQHGDSVTQADSGGRKRGHLAGSEVLVDGKVRKVESFVANPPESEEFVWVVDKFSEKRRNAQNGINVEIFSEPFYSNRYKMRLLLCPFGSDTGRGSHLSLFFQIMRGEFDATLAWPMRDTVTVTLASYDTSVVPHLVRHYKHDALPEKIRITFDRPKTDFNTSCGNTKLILLESLLSNSSFCRNDQILLKCSIGGGGGVES